MSVSTHLAIDLREYDARIRTFIPDYEEMLDTAAAALTAVERPIRTIVDLGTGTGALAARALKAVPRAGLVGIDEDGGMLDVARRRLARRRATFVAASFMVARLPPSDAIIASFALHHVEARRAKLRLYRRAHASLRRGGVLVSADCHPSSLPAVAAKGRQAWLDHLAAEYGQKGARRYLDAWAQEDFYVPLDEELRLLDAAGFVADVVWRRGSFAVLAARKA